MSSVIQQEDFSTTGTVDGLLWSAIGAGAGLYISDGVRGYISEPLGWGVDQQMTMVAFQPAPSTPIPRKIQYELDLQWPAVLPGGSGNLIMGVTGLQRSSGRDGLWLLVRRLTGGATNVWSLIIAGVTSSSDLVLQSVAFTPAVNDMIRVTLDITFAVGVSFTGVMTIAKTDAITFVTTTTVQPFAMGLAQFNTVTSRALATTDACTKYGGIFVRVDGSPSNNTRPYVDRFRIRDTNVTAQLPDLHPEYTLTAAPSLTPISLGDEDATSPSYTLTVQPSWTTQLEDQWTANEFNTDGGTQIVTAKQARRRRRWGFHWQAINATDWGTVNTLIDNTHQGHKSFNWADPETGVTIPLRFTSPLSTQQIGPSVYTAEADVEEVLA